VEETIHDLLEQNADLLSGREFVCLWGDESDERVMGIVGRLSQAAKTSPRSHHKLSLGIIRRGGDGPVWTAGEMKSLLTQHELD
jgi:hypothetical protein